MADGSSAFNFPLPQVSRLRPGEIVIDRTADGRLITGTAAVRMVGNSVSPPPLCALAIANLDPTPDPVELQEAA